jgi:hypothetical protein
VLVKRGTAELSRYFATFLVPQWKNGADIENEFALPFVLSAPNTGAEQKHWSFSEASARPASKQDGHASVLLRFSLADPALTDELLHTTTTFATRLQMTTLSVHPQTGQTSRSAAKYPLQ